MENITITMKDMQARLTQVAIAREMDALKLEALGGEVSRLVAELAERDAELDECAAEYMALRHELSEDDEVDSLSANG